MYFLSSFNLNTDVDGATRADGMTGVDGATGADGKTGLKLYHFNKHRAQGIRVHSRSD